jgi:hypothetical protein
MYGYEYGSSNPFTSRTNGSAHDLLNANPALFGSGGFGNQPAAQNPWFNTPFTGAQQQPYTQQGMNPGWQQQFNPWQQYPQQFQQQQPQQWQQQPWNQAATSGNWPQPQQQFGFGISPSNQAPVYTTKAVDVELTIPAQTVLGRNPIEIQQYLLQFVVPTLIDALTKRAIAHDTGRSVSYDVRGGCVARVGI